MTRRAAALNLIRRLDLHRLLDRAGRLTRVDRAAINELTATYRAA